MTWHANAQDLHVNLPLFLSSRSAQSSAPTDLNETALNTEPHPHPYLLDPDTDEEEEEDDADVNILWDEEEELSQTVLWRTSMKDFIVTTNIRVRVNSFTFSLLYILASLKINISQYWRAAILRDS